MPEDLAAMTRVLVVGTSGSGKTTLAKRLADALGLRHVELDALYWNRGWQPKPTTEFVNAVEQAIAVDRWVLDGNYGTLRQLVWPRASDVIWLNYEFPVVFWRGFSRTLQRALSGAEFCGENRESLGRAFFSRDSILWWTITTFRRRRRELSSLRDQQSFPHLIWHEFRNAQDTERFVTSLEAGVHPARAP